MCVFCAFVFVVSVCFGFYICVFGACTCVFVVHMCDCCVFGFVVSLWFSIVVFLVHAYGSVSAGREKWPFNVLFFLKVEPPCDQT